jgi:P-type conjugative transfer protein TrbG
MRYLLFACPFLIFAMSARAQVDKSPATEEVPQEFKPKTDVELTPTAKTAVEVSENWSAEINPPAPGPDGRVLYSYGAGQPIIVCAPLRLCTIELEPGEHIVGVPQIGDSLRWRVSPASYGKGDDATTILVLKPLNAGLDTTLLVTTDRRAYYLRLVSKPEDFTARVAFDYPEYSADQWKAFVVRQEEDQKNTKKDDGPLPANIESMNFEYAIKGDKAIRPLQVFDDGQKTFIRMNPKIKYREAPALAVVGPDKKPEMLNYRVKDAMYIVDRLFDRAELVLGAGKKARKVEIIRETRRTS